MIRLSFYYAEPKFLSLDPKDHRIKGGSGLYMKEGCNYDSSNI